MREKRRERREEKENGHDQARALQPHDFFLSFFSTYTATGHDLHALLFTFLDELLFGFATEGFACAELKVTRLVRGGQRNSDAGGDGTAQAPWSLTAVGKGETFDRTRHAAGTEVKAITYSAMRVDEEGAEKGQGTGGGGGGGKAEVWVIVDI